MPAILVVEDDPNIASALKKALQMESHEVDVEANGDLAFKRILAGSFDLILLDVVLLPDTMDGYTISREVRKAGNRTPILMLTCKGSDAEKVLGLDAGSDDYIVKPFSLMEVLARVRAVLRRAMNSDDSKEQVYGFGSVVANMLTGEVRVRDKRVDLTQTEFTLLRVFLESRGRILTRQQLLDKTRGHDNNSTDRAVDQHIFTLRKKIEDDPQNPVHIKSVRGVGYRFERQVSSSSS